MKRKSIITICVILLGVVILSVYGIRGVRLNSIFTANGTQAQNGYDISGNEVFPDVIPLPIPSGNLNASQTIVLPDLYETGKGWTCTGLAYDASNDTFLVGDIGILQPGVGTIQSQIVRVSADFSTIEETISLYSIFPDMADVQGITIDTSDGTIWCCCPSKNKLYHLASDGTSIGTVAVTSPTGIAYSPLDDTFWVLNYNNKIVHISKSGSVTESYDFAYTDQLDQCFLDAGHGLLYITAGANYSTRNNVYCFNTATHEQSIACTVDSYSVEGIWIGQNEMVIVNDGYYHSAADPRNVANIYDLT